MAQRSSPASGLYVGDIERQNVNTPDGESQTTFSETAIGTVPAGGSVSNVMTITFDDDERPIIGKFKVMFDVDVIATFDAYLVFPNGTEQRVDKYMVRQSWYEATPMSELAIPAGTDVELRNLQNPSDSEPLEYNIVTIGIIDKV